MNDDRDSEDYWKKQTEIKWKTFWKRYEDNYPMANHLENKIVNKFTEMYQNVSLSIGQNMPGDFSINEEGDFVSYEPFFLMLGAIGEMTLEETKKLIKKEIEKPNSELTEIKSELQKIERLLKYAIPELDTLIECPHCKEYNAPDMTYCIRCQKRILTEGKNGRKE